MASLERAANFLQLSLKALIVPVTFGVRVIMQDSRGRVALIKHSYRSGWHLPGGGVNRHEAPELAAVREAQEEAGLLSSAPAQFFGLYSARAGWVSNVVAVYCLAEAEAEFKKSFEVREMMWADPEAPPQGTTAATLRRLAELSGKAAKSSFW